MDVGLRFCFDRIRRTRIRGDFATSPARLSGLRFGDKGGGEPGAVTKDNAGDDGATEDLGSESGGSKIEGPGEGGVFGSCVDVERVEGGDRGDAGGVIV